ncbi:MAG: hypothetical protein QXV17_14545 [Candidatus Micrarchaeaceae archaeon]
MANGQHDNVTKNTEPVNFGVRLENEENANRKISIIGGDSKFYGP